MFFGFVLENVMFFGFVFNKMEFLLTKKKGDEHSDVLQMAHLGL